MRKQRKARSKNNLYKNSNGEPWFECGNRMHIYGFYPCDDQGNPLQDIDEGEYYSCDQCGSFYRMAKLSSGRSPNLDSPS